MFLTTIANQHKRLSEKRVPFRSVYLSYYESYYNLSLVHADSTACTAVFSINNVHLLSMIDGQLMENGEVTDSIHSNWVYLAPSVLWQVNVNYLHVTNNRYECHSTEINYPFIIIIIISTSWVYNTAVYCFCV